MGMGICRRSIVAAGLALLVAGGLPTIASAGAITDFATDADNLLLQGKPAEALSAFDKATDAFWAASPLQFRVATFASSVKGFGQYEPLADASFRSGDTATVYLEPVGYGFTSDRSVVHGRLHPGIEIRTAGGILLAKTDNLGSLEWQGLRKNYSVPAIVNVTLPTLKPGSYKLTLTLTDGATAKQASVTLPFVDHANRQT